MINALHTVIIGKEVPELAKRVMALNEELCARENIPFIVHSLTNMNGFLFTGCAADCEKTKILSTGDEILVMDYDVQILSLASPEGSAPAFGVNRKRPDGCIVYSGHGNREFFTDLYNRLSCNKNLYIANVITKDVTLIPETYYIHHNAGTGIFPVSFGNMLPHQQYMINQRNAGKCLPEKSK